MINRRPINASCDESLIRDMDEIVEASRGRYANRSHFVQMAIQLLLDKEKGSPPAKNR